MAANSLLYLLLSTGLTVPPEQSVTPESNFDAVQWDKPTTKWPGYEENFQDAGVFWKEEPGYGTDKPLDQFTAQPEATEEPPVNYDERRRNWLRATEEPPVNYDERSRNWLRATEEPPVNYEEDEGERAQVLVQKKKKKRSCPRREHMSKRKYCEMTCSNYNNRDRCKGKKGNKEEGCVCDGSLVRNNKGKCVSPGQCGKKEMAAEENSHGCPYEYSCDVHCAVTENKKGHCEGDICKCLDR